MLRIPAPGRIEDRTVDGSCNPYLAAAAVLASGLDGIATEARRRRAELGEPLRDAVPRADRLGACESLPATLHEATVELEQDDVLRAALGRTRENEEYVDYYVRVKQEEWFRYHEQVSAWEVREYLTRF